MNQTYKLLPNRVVKLVFLTTVLVLAAPLWMKTARKSEFKVEANPAWSRKYNAQCTLCHTTYPRLNRTGYEFKRLGYRLPREVEAKNKGRAPALQHSGSGEAGHQS